MAASERVEKIYNYTQTVTALLENCEAGEIDGITYSFILGDLNDAMNAAYDAVRRKNEQTTE